jgi:hypothetical protein
MVGRNGRINRVNLTHFSSYFSYFYINQSSFFLSTVSANRNT